MSFQMQATHSCQEVNPSAWYCMSLGWDFQPCIKQSLRVWHVICSGQFIRAALLCQAEQEELARQDEGLWCVRLFRIVQVCEHPGSQMHVEPPVQFLGGTLLETNIASSWKWWKRKVIFPTTLKWTMLVSRVNLCKSDSGAAICRCFEWKAMRWELLYDVRRLYPSTPAAICSTQPHTGTRTLWWSGTRVAGREMQLPRSRSNEPGLGGPLVSVTL